MPAYLRFVRGVIDSSDLPLNVSREILQQSRDVADHPRRVDQARARRCSKTWPSKQPEKYATFWKEFGRVLKEGVAEDAANRERIAKLLRFASTQQRQRRADGVARRLRRPDEGRAGGDLLHHRRQLRRRRSNSPHLEIFRKLGVEVLLLHDRVDEWVVSSLTEFDGKPLQSVAKGDLDLEQAGRRGRQKRAGDAGRTSTRRCSSGSRRRSKDRASAVRVTQRLTDSPACLVSDEHGMSTQPRADAEGGGPERSRRSKPILEINPEHPIVARLKRRDRRGAVRRLEPDPVRSGDAGRRRAARGSGDVRQAPQRADADAGRRRPRRASGRPARSSGRDRVDGRLKPDPTTCGRVAPVLFNRPACRTQVLKTFVGPVLWTGQRAGCRGCGGRRDFNAEVGRGAEARRAEYPVRRAPGRVRSAR